MLATHNETSTGVTSDIPGVRKALDAAGHPALLFSDGVSAIGSIDFRQDEWGVDASIAGSQKVLCCRPVWRFWASAKSPGGHRQQQLPAFVLSLKDMAASNKDGYTPYTPSTPMLYGLRKALELLLEEGMENVYARHHRLGEGVRRAVAAWGLQACAQEGWASDTVTAIVVPADKDARHVISTAYNKYNISLGAGERSGR